RSLQQCSSSSGSNNDLDNRLPITTILDRKATTTPSSSFCIKYTGSTSSSKKMLIFNKVSIDNKESKDSLSNQLTKVVFKVNDIVKTRKYSTKNLIHRSNQTAKQLDIVASNEGRFIIHCLPE